MNWENSFDLKKLIERGKKVPRWMIISGYVLIGVITGFVLVSAMQSSTNDLSAQDSKIRSINIALDVFTKLFVVVIVILMTALIFSKWRGVAVNKKQKQLSIIETLPIGSKKSLLLVKAGEDVVLLGTTDQSITFLKELSFFECETLEKVVPASPTGGIKFQQLLKENLVNKNEI